MNQMNNTKEKLTHSNIIKKKMRKLSHVTILDEYVVDMNTILGQGSTGCVYQGSNIKTGEKVAIKVVDLSTIDNEVAAYLLAMEKNALMIVNNPYILKGLKIAQDSHYCFMVTEFCNGGTLKKQIRNSSNGFLSEQRAMTIFYYLLLGYNSLAQKGIIHRDLKPANIMLHNGKPKIIDFGFCEVQGFTKPQLEYNVGSPSYMAPQSFQLNIYNQKTQIWALGVIYYEILTGKTFDDGRYMSQVYYQIQITGIPYPSHVSSLAKNIINWCLNKNPKNRPTCAQLLTTCFANRNRTKSSLSPSISYSQFQCQQKLQIYSKKHLFSVYGTEMAAFRTGQTLLTSTKIENKTKKYKIPDFLQASKKNKQEKQNIYPVKTHSVHKRLIQLNHTKKNNKEQKQIDDKKIEKNQNKLKGCKINWQYGHLSPSRNYSKIFENKKKSNVEQLYNKICKSTHLLTKNKAVSNHENKSPHWNNHIASKQYGSTFNKEFINRNKKIISERDNVFRA